MTTRGKAYWRSDRRRLLSSFLAAVILHSFAFGALAWFAHRSLVRNVETEDERLMVTPSSIRIERRIAARPQRRPDIARVPRPQPRPLEPAPQAQDPVSAPSQGASISLSPDWAKQDYGNMAATDVKIYLDWTKQSANFVPRVMLWQMQAADPYMRRPSLQDAIQAVSSSVRARGTKIDVSKAQRVCDGERPGWFFSYLDTTEDPALRVEETLFAAGDTVYRATYLRPADQPEDPKARAALNTLCQ
jgi:hypothetical protein